MFQLLLTNINKFIFLFGLSVVAFSSVVAADITNDQGELVSMDFQDVDIREVTSFVAEMTGRNYVIPERLKGKVSIVTPTPILKSEATHVFETILSAYGYSIVQSGEVYRLLPNQDAIREGDEILSGRQPPAGLSDLHSRILKLKHVDAASVAAPLKTFSHKWGAIAVHAPTNSLIVTDTATIVRKLLKIVKRLDVPRGVGELKIFPLTHTSVVKIEKLVNSVYSIYNTKQPKTAPQVKLFSDVRTNSLLVLAPFIKMGEISSLISRLDKKTGHGAGNLHIYYPKNIAAKTIASVLNDLINKTKGNQSSVQPLEFSGPVSIVSEDKTNTLIVAANQDDYELLYQVIDGLDLPRQQVYVEALIVEINADKTSKIGVEWRFTNDWKAAGAGTAGYGGSLLGGISDVVANPLGTHGLVIGVVKGSIDVGGTAVPNIGALIQAMEKDSDVNIISTPHLITSDNHEAEIVVGQNVPIVTGTTASTGEGLTSSFERKDVGLKLKIKPEIMEGGRINMVVHQEVTSLTTSLSLQSTTLKDTQQVVTNTRSIDTAISVKNGEMVALGGLMQENTQEVVTQTPCLGGIPKIGEAFKYTSRQKKKTNLVVFMQPTIIDKYEVAQEVAQDRRSEIEQLWDNFDEKGSILTPRLETVPIPGL